MSMMSMFSSFDALMAESFGQKVGLSWPLITKQRAVSSEREKKEETHGASNKSSSVSKEKASPGNQENRLRKARFAPELDGVNCFESIIPY
nr:PREDICTED: uncharacterized protein LOC108226458 [Daucus carota subsp. sativus]